MKHADLTSFPATVTINSQEAITGLYPSSPVAGQVAPLPVKGLTSSAINRIDLPSTKIRNAVVFTFEYVMKDGRRIVLTPLSSAAGSTGAVIPNTFVNAPLAAIAVFR